MEHQNVQNCHAIRSKVVLINHSLQNAATDLRVIMSRTANNYMQNSYAPCYLCIHRAFAALPFVSGQVMFLFLPPTAPEICYRYEIHFFWWTDKIFSYYEPLWWSDAVGLWHPAFSLRCHPGLMSNSCRSLNPLQNVITRSSQLWTWILIAV